MNEHRVVRLPAGDALSWDLTTLTKTQLEYEYKLCYENLYGAEIAGFPVLRGLMNDDKYFKSLGVNDEQLAKAKSTWQLRLKRAGDELFERKLL